MTNLVTVLYHHLPGFVAYFDFQVYVLINGYMSKTSNFSHHGTKSMLVSSSVSSLLLKSSWRQDSTNLIKMTISDNSILSTKVYLRQV